MMLFENVSLCFK